MICYESLFLREIGDIWWWCASYRCFRTILVFVHWDSTMAVDADQLGMALWLSSVASLHPFFFVLAPEC